MLRILKFAVALCISTLGFGQISFNTGSIEFDNNLKKINAEAKLNIGGFEANLSSSYNVSKKQINHLKVDLGMEPAEIYLLCELSKTSGKSVPQVEQSYSRNKGKGWGAIAKDLGIKPGSPEFHALKNKSKNKAAKGKGKSKGKGHGKKKK